MLHFLVWAILANYIDGSGHVHELYNGPISSGIWIDNDLIQKTNGVPAAGDSALDGYWDGGGQHVNYIDGNGDVHELYNGPFSSGIWIDNDLIQITNDVPAAGGSALDGYWDGGGQHVNYIDADGHVHELYNGPFSSGIWIDNDLIHITNGAPSFGANALDGYWDGSAQHVNYIDGVGHVHELYNGPFSSGTWADNDLTQIANRVPAAVFSHLDGYWDGSGQHVNYIDINSDGHVYELYNGAFSCTPWVDNDLIQTANGAPAVTGSHLDGYWDGAGEHVNYIDANQNVHELYSFRPSE